MKPFSSCNQHLRFYNNYDINAVAHGIGGWTVSAQHSREDLRGLIVSELTNQLDQINALDAQW